MTRLLVVPERICWTCDEPLSPTATQCECGERQLPPVLRPVEPPALSPLPRCSNGGACGFCTFCVISMYDNGIGL